MANIWGFQAKEGVSIESRYLYVRYMTAYWPYWVLPPADTFIRPCCEPRLSRPSR